MKGDKKMKHPTISELAALIREIQNQIEDEFRAFDDDNEPGILLTIATDGENWTYQTGDLQFYGNAYGYDVMATTAIYRDSDCRELAKSLRRDLENAFACLI
ncbi:MAG: hypothetical protein RML32_10305 [Gammaproteobacteria bacterium]|nr:hypothetical protein [Gammaproteobacteria bacterium]